MFDYRCEECQKGTVKAKKSRNYEVRIFDETFIVPTATIGVCNQCGTQNFDGREMHRWETLYNRWLAKRRQVLSPERIRTVRESLRLSQKDFARFLGVSRQSIAAWEKDTRPSVQPVNVDVLLQLLYAELNSDDKPVTAKMLEQFQRRTGEQISLADKKGKRTAESNALLQKILPRSTWETLITRAKENHTEPYIEAILAIESNRLQYPVHRGKEIRITPRDWKENPDLVETYHTEEAGTPTKQISRYILTGRKPAYEC